MIYVPQLYTWNVLNNTALLVKIPYHVIQTNLSKETMIKGTVKEK